jgi:transketolase
MSHHATEDLAVARSLPNLTVVAPNDPWEAEAATRAIVGLDGPCYLRLGRAGERRIHSGPIEFHFGRAIEVRPGADAVFLAGGGMLGNAVDAAGVLAEGGLDVRVLSVPTLKPLDEEAIIAAASAAAMFTIEEHSCIGALGGAVSELLMEQRVRPAIFKRIGLADRFVSVGGSQEALKRRGGLDVASLVRTVVGCMHRGTMPVEV